MYSDIFSPLPVNHFIRKPIDNEDLLKRINEVIMVDTTYRTVASEMMVLTK